MTMTIDNQQRYPLNFDHMSSYSSSQPQFTNPWVSSSSQNPALYVNTQGLSSGSLGGMDSIAKQQQPPSRASTSSSASMASYGSMPVSAASAGSPLMATELYTNGQQDLLSMPNQDLLGGLNRMQTTSAGYGPEPVYTTAASPVHGSYTSSPAPYSDLSGYGAAPMRSAFVAGMTGAHDADHPSRRFSQPSVPASYGDDGTTSPRHPNRNSLVDFNHRGLPPADDRRGFADALEASHGMLSMSQETPRNIYGNRSRGSTDSYGFPSTHSTSSSVSSSTGFSGYYGSVDSVSDYSTAGSDIESVTSRTLPRPQGLMATQPPAPQSMMGQFSSKVSSSTQKKHKCKVCDKRFTRPSSLQTHMYSHTGEKPFSCEVEGCGRHFSVVSNLRRHRKVHKGEARSETSEDHHSD